MKEELRMANGSTIAFGGQDANEPLRGAKRWTKEDDRYAGWFVQYIIYENPPEYPTTCVLRCFSIIGGGTPMQPLRPLAVGPLEIVRAMIPPGYELQHPTELDDPSIKEVWS